MTRMQRRWTSFRPTARKQAEPVPIETRVENSPRSRRTRKALNAEFAKAMEFRGAVRNSKVRKLLALAAKVPGYTVPEDIG